MLITKYEREGEVYQSRFYSRKFDNKSGTYEKQ